ncbi:AMP-binding protein [Lipingzhangella sp. LS1_29]|uniref:acetate--CoA ligase n=1 Tax=Lipingzhangella rawalii TaxID=2055835 RepID=A0ABU2H699_9ACTN|nr:AMP-binding protein [Lipingzhangella rawalii]MDS1270826.1 AMP-binding protein [Lipingzhangella rawalii]
MAEDWAHRWTRAAEELVWDTPWSRLYTPEEPYGRWFTGGRLNIATNCVDRHAEREGDRPALLWEGEPGDRRAFTYAELRGAVRTAAAMLRGLGVGAGDRVALHLGWLPETVVAMLACGRLGAVHTILPTPLPAEALAERLDDFQPKLLLTQDGAWRHGTILPLKARADEALSAVGGVEQTIVIRRTGVDVSWYAGDRWWHEATGVETCTEPERPEARAAEHPLLATPMANRRGRPVSAVHGTANVLVTASTIHRYGMSPGGVFWCAGDITWLGAQVHGVYGPLSRGDTAVMFEGTLDVPNRDRTWDIVERYGVQTMVTSPSVVRRLRGWARRAPDQCRVSTLRRIVTLGEPIEPDLTRWLRDQIGTGGLDIADGWGQVELNGVVRLDRPVDATRIPEPGLAIVDENGATVASGERGELVLTNPWAGMLRGLEGVGAEDAARHWRRYPGSYATGDVASYRDTGDPHRPELIFHGRLDQVISVSGQLVSLTEVREALLAHPFVADAEVCERSDPRLGRSLAAAVVLATGVSTDNTTTLARDLLDAVREVLGGLARPRALCFVDRFGPELSAEARRRALAVLLAGAGEEPCTLTWDQLLAAAREDPVPGR